MKKYYIKLFSFSAFLILFASKSNAQVTNYIYGINYAAGNVFYFSKVEISTGVTTNLQLLPISTITSNASSCIDNANQIYYLSTGDSLMALDAVSGNLLSYFALPINAGSHFLYNQFNPCDSGIYGLIAAGTSFTFARFTPSTGILTSFSTFQYTSGYGPAGMSIIDEAAQLFIVTFIQYELKGFDLLTGQTVFNTPIINLPGEVFGHLAIKCSNYQIYGTSAVPSTVKYLATVDPLTGIVTHVSATGWNMGIWKPEIGGDCINQLTGDYYYSGDPDVIVGANTVSGNVTASFSLASGLEFLFLEHFSQCPCIATAIEENNIPLDGINIFPNPATGTIQLTISTKHNAPVHCEIITVMGGIVYEAPLPASPRGGEGSYAVLDVSFLAKGIYIVRVGDGKSFENKKLMIE